MWIIPLAILVVIELYYWFYWLPRNWEKTREADDFRALKQLYGKDGIVPKLAKKGVL